ncbi:hypothetical protein BJ742DRAFT_779359 [Cladochytrium replicatum]|nr:hypothetical protein BJ742DRAFT_779359 [Cladochytrium replicatum]
MLGGALASPHWGKVLAFAYEPVRIRRDKSRSTGTLASSRLSSTSPWKLVVSLPSFVFTHGMAVRTPMQRLDETDLIRELRKELYVEDYDSIKWSTHRNS